MKKSSVSLFCRRKRSIRFLLSALLVLLVIFITPLSLIAQTKPVMKTITGVVRATDGETLPGAVINLEGTVYAAISDIDGKFKLEIPAITTDEARIIVRLTGMEQLTIPYDGKSSFNFVMEESVKELDEVVVTGYQSVNRRDMVGAHTTLKADEILMPNYTSIDEMLQGQVAGLVVTNTSNRVGASPTMTLRGTSTLLGTTSPLWVVDGIIQQDVESFYTKSPMLSSANSNDMAQLVGNSISWLNPNDIESIVVLKDASATAIYGSRASNGVIVITTKEGQREGISVNYRASMTIAVRPTYDDYYLMNSKERINFSKEAYDAGAYYQRIPYAQMYTYEGLMKLYLDREITENQFINQYKYLETVNTNWLDLLTRTSVNHQHNLNVSGGSKNTHYNVSVNYSKTNGTEIGNDGEAFSARMRLGFDISSRLKLDVSLVGSLNKTRGFSSGVNPQNYAITASRAIPAYEGDEYAYYQKYAAYEYNAGVKEEGLKYNILNELENSYAKSNSPQLNTTINLDWDILGNGVLKYSLVGGYTNYTRSLEAYADEKTFYIAENFRGYDYGAYGSDDETGHFLAAKLRFGGTMLKNTTATYSYNIQNKLLFAKTFDKKHRVSGLAAVELRSNKTRSNENTIHGYMKSRNGLIVTPPTPSQVVSMNGSSSNSNPEGIMYDIYGGYRVYEELDNYLSLFTSWTYAYNSKYIFNFNLRNDLTNRFGQDVNNRFDPSYSFGASWWATEEDFMQTVHPYISTLALKVTYGIQGNVLTNYSPELILNNPEIINEYQQFGSTIRRLPNELLDWERTKSWNWGMNLGLFNNKIMLDIDGYLRNSKPLASFPLTPEYGSTKLPQNGSVIENSGIELTASFSPIKKKDMNLRISMNFSKNWNTVKDKSRTTKESITTGSYLKGNKTAEGMILEQGYPINGFWVYSFDKLDPETGYPIFKNMDMTDFSSIADYLTYAGSKEPLMSSGININFSYKNFSLNTGLAATLGGKTLLVNPYENFSSGTLPDSDYNLNKELTNRWRYPGDEQKTTIPGVYTGGDPISIKDPKGYFNDIYTMWASSDDRLVSKSFLRCRQIALSWYVPQDMLRPLGAKSLSLTGSVNNIFVIASSKYKGMDPETMRSIMPKSFSLSLSVGF